MSMVRIIATTTENTREVIEYPYSGTVELRHIVRDVTGSVPIEGQWEFGLGKMLGDFYRDSGKFTDVEVLMLTDEMAEAEKK